MMHIPYYDMVLAVHSCFILVSEMHATFRVLFRNTTYTPLITLKHCCDVIVSVIASL
jgi:hypothetical protein